MEGSQRGLLIILSAPSGGGKSTLARLLRERRGDIGVSISHTTRAPRGNERDGVEYHFVDDAAFDVMVSTHAFAEWANVYGRRYGTSRAEIERIRGQGRHVLLDIDIQGAVSIMALYSDAVSVFIMPPDLETLERRLRRRGTETDAAMASRLAAAKAEIAQHHLYKYTLINDDLHRAVDDLQSILRAEELLTPRSGPLAPGLVA